MLDHGRCEPYDEYRKVLQKMHKIIQARALENYRVELEFEDGTKGVIDLAHLVGKGVFARWQDEAEFKKLKIGEHGELKWGNDLDLCPDSLYLKVTSKTPEDEFPGLRPRIANA